MPAPVTLNDRQLRFIDEYMKDGSSVKAANRAGYKGAKTGPRLLTYPLVRAEIDRRNKDLGERSILTKQKVIDKIVEMMDGAKTDTIQLKSAEIAGRLLGMFVEKTEVVEHMTELDRRLSELMEKQGPDGINSLMDKLDGSDKPKS